MKAKVLLLLPSVIWTAGALGADSNAKAVPGTTTGSQPSLVLPAGPAGTTEVLDPLVKMPPEGAAPFVPKFDSEPLLPPDSLAGWQITRMPSRENRDACAAFWSRVRSSKTQWTVVPDAASGSAKAVRDAMPAPREGAPKFMLRVERPQQAAELREIIPDEVVKVPDGWLVAMRKDPVLAWFSADGAQSRLISTQTVMSLTANGDRWLALNPERRGLVELSRDGNGQWVTKDFHRLPGTPRTMTVLPDGRFCIATQDQLLACSMDRTLEVLLAHPGWSSLSPGSMLYDEKADRVFVGLRHFVARCAITPGQRGIVMLRPLGE